MPDKNNPADSVHAPNTGKKIFDIVRPGAALADATSRPVIVSRTPKVQEDINGISVRPVAQDVQEESVEPKPRITVQPAGTLNRDIIEEAVNAAPDTVTAIKGPDFPESLPTSFDSYGELSKVLHQGDIEPKQHHEKPDLKVAEAAKELSQDTQTEDLADKIIISEHVPVAKRSYRIWFIMGGVILLCAAGWIVYTWLLLQQR